MHMITYTYTHRQIYNYTLGFDDPVIVGEGSKPALMLSFENNEMCQKKVFEPIPMTETLRTEISLEGS